VSSLNEFKDGEFPPIPLSLLERLETQIPEKCPDIPMHEREIFFYAGMRSVVRMLREVYNEQNEVS
jgi:hypothetical protein